MCECGNANLDETVADLEDRLRIVELAIGSFGAEMTTVGNCLIEAGDILEALLPGDKEQDDECGPEEVELGVEEEDDSAVEEGLRLVQMLAGGEGTDDNPGDASGTGDDGSPLKVTGEESSPH